MLKVNIHWLWLVNLGSIVLFDNAAMIDRLTTIALAAAMSSAI
jgi:hypothetical protein